MTIKIDNEYFCWEMDELTCDIPYDYPRPNLSAGLILLVEDISEVDSSPGKCIVLI